MVKSGDYLNYTLDVPQKEGAKGYVGMFFEMCLKVSATIQNPEFSKEPMAVYYLINWIVSMIPEHNERARIIEVMKKQKKEMEQEYKSNNIEITPKLRDHILIMSSLFVGGEIADFVDKHVGISSNNKIGWAVNRSKDIIIKGSAIDIKITEMERQISDKDREIEQLKLRLAKVIKE